MNPRPTRVDQPAAASRRQVSWATRPDRSTLAQRCRARIRERQRTWWRCRFWIRLSFVNDHALAVSSMVDEVWKPVSCCLPIRPKPRSFPQPAAVPSVLAEHYANWIKLIFTGMRARSLWRNFRSWDNCQTAGPSAPGKAARRPAPGRVNLCAFQ